MKAAQFVLGVSGNLGGRLKNKARVAKLASS